MALVTQKDRVETKRIFDGHIINLRVDYVQLDNGRRLSREVVEHNGGVVIVSQPNDQEVILIRQYRYPVDEELFELPAGRIDLGEDPLFAAQRELIEETGFKGEHWSELCRMYSAPGFCNEMLYVYLARELNFVGKNLDEDEETHVEVLTLADAWSLVTAGKVRDAKTIAGLGLLINK